MPSKCHNCTALSAKLEKMKGRMLFFKSQLSYDSDNSSLSYDNIGGVSNISGDIESDDEDLDCDDAEIFTSEPSALSQVDEEPSVEESSTDTESEAGDNAVGESLAAKERECVFNDKSMKFSTNVDLLILNDFRYRGIAGNVWERNKWI
ncbi:Hypothetical predicted protein [Paramuricea clavata]|uniref:Uncharacterized protein n=1 Tax=Paramuricea clavata TaxID=317549 RepID=A0A6S7FJ51_PARCT|nr:Hypothetical predicted protein [Paramuricea clavata]